MGTSLSGIFQEWEQVSLVYSKNGNKSHWNIPEMFLFAVVAGLGLETLGGTVCYSRFCFKLSGYVRVEKQIALSEFYIEIYIYI